MLYVASKMLKQERNLLSPKDSTGQYLNAFVFKYIFVFINTLTFMYLNTLMSI